MAVKKETAPAEAVQVDEDDEIWAKLQTENYVPPLSFKGLTFTEPSKTQVDKWRSATTIEDGERAIFGDMYDAVHQLFDPRPEHIWENFNVLYLRHFFGTAGDDALKG